MITIITGIFAAVARNVILGWVWRRVQELVGWIAALAPLFLMLPPQYQELVLGILRGQGGGYSVSVYFGFAVWLWSQWQSYRSTTHDQVVAGNQKVKIKELPTYTQDEVLDVVARETGKRPVIVPKP
jgi:hypothetical protein